METSQQAARMTHADTHDLRARLHSVHPHAVTAFEALAVAGKAISEAFLSQTRSAVKEKGLGDLVTETDTQAERAALAVLRLSTPDFKIVSEESAPGVLGPDRSASTWVLDPLDATSAFIFRTNPAHPAVMIALHQEGEYQLSMIHLPLTDQWYLAARGKGAYRISKAQELERLGAHASLGSLSQGWVALNWYGDSRQDAPAFHAVATALRGSHGARLVTVETPHSSIACRMLSEGTPLAVLHDNNALKVKQAEWDIAPVRLLVEEAGGVFMDGTGKRYARPEQGPIFLAANPAVGAELLALQPGCEGRTQNIQVVRPDVAALHRFFLEHGANEWNYLPSEELRAHLLKTQSGEVRCVCAYSAGKLLGVATYEVGNFYSWHRAAEELNTPVGYVAEVTVHKDQQKQGIGADLLRYALAALRAEGMTTVFAKRHEENLGSAGMLRKAGFQIVDTFPDPIRSTGSRCTSVERFVAG